MASPSGAAGAAPATPPLPPASPPPPSTDSPPPAVSSPPASQPGVPPTSLSPPTVPGSPPPASPPPTVTPVPSSTPPISPPPTASPPLVASPPPPFQAPPPASPPEASPPPPSAAPPPDSPPPPPLPAPSPTTVVPSPPVASPPPVVAPPPTPAESSAPTPPASLPPASPPPPSTAPPTTSPQPPSPTPSRPTVAPSPPGGLTPPPVASPPPTVGLPPPVASPPPTPARAAGPTPSRPAPPPAEHSPSPPPVAGLPSPPDSQTPAIPSPSPPARNETQPSPSVSPPGKSPSPPPSSSRSPPSNPTPSGPPSPAPVGNSSHPRVPIIPAPPGPNISRTSNSSPGASLPEDVSPSEGGGIKIGTAIGIAVVVSLVVLGLLGIVLWSVKKRKRQAGGFAGGHVMPSPFNSSRMSDYSDPRSPTPLVKNSSARHGFQYSQSDPGLGHSRPWFTYEELSEITNGFSSQNLLGEGGFGCVYKGQLPDGREVAVKQLKVDGGQGDREFRAEVEIISRVHHRHLVSLVGFCISENQKLLIYDYVPNNTLHYHLHGEGRAVMDWARRLKVALGAARGLAYLHEDCHPRIIHRDIKSSNILLDNNYEARVSDFGLAKLAMDANTHVTTRVVGTFGYLAPEYASSGKLTSKSDVFSFGVVLLELVTGRKPVDPSQPVGDESLVEWARPLMSHALETGEFEDLPDPRLEKNYNQSEMFRMIEVAAACVRHSAAMRPHMGQVVRALDGLGHSTDLHNGMTPGQSELFNSAQQSEEIRLFQRMAFGSQNFSSDFSQTSWSKKL